MSCAGQLYGRENPHVLSHPTTAAVLKNITRMRCTMTHNTNIMNHAAMCVPSCGDNVIALDYAFLTLISKLPTTGYAHVPLRYWVTLPKRQAPTTAVSSKVSITVHCTRCHANKCHTVSTNISSDKHTYSGTLLKCLPCHYD